MPSTSQCRGFQTGQRQRTPWAWGSQRPRKAAPEIGGRVQELFRELAVSLKLFLLPEPQAQQGLVSVLEEFMF